MDDALIISELSDRHEGNLIYNGQYRLFRHAFNDPTISSLIERFNSWRQRIYRFDNDYGASIVLYGNLSAKKRMTWDLALAWFAEDDPFSFQVQGGITSNLKWTQVQQVLDEIKHKTP
ncbi:MAG: hypothetical protein AAF708_06985 [Deinococcota bacterium]